MQQNEGYGNCSKGEHFTHSVQSDRMLVFKSGFHKRLVRIANREDPHQTASASSSKPAP